jgi:hypothetical protein
MKITAAINAVTVALAVAKANRSDKHAEELRNGLDILRAHESQGTGPARSAGVSGTDGKNIPAEKPTLVIQWGGSRELKGTL